MKQNGKTQREEEDHIFQRHTERVHCFSEGDREREKMAGINNSYLNSQQVGCLTVAPVPSVSGLFSFGSFLINIPKVSTIYYYYRLRLGPTSFLQYTTPHTLSFSTFLYISLSIVCLDKGLFIVKK